MLCWMPSYMPVMHAPLTRVPYGHIGCNQQSVIDRHGVRTGLLDRTTGQDCWTVLLDRTAGQDYWTVLLDRTTGQDCWTVLWEGFWDGFYQGVHTIGHDGP